MLLKIIFLSIFYKIRYEITWRDDKGSYTVILDKYKDVKSTKKDLKMKGMSCNVELMLFDKNSYC